MHQQSEIRRRFYSFFIWTILVGGATAVAQTDSADDFELRDGDTVVFLGDSITAARTYGQIIENYTLLRYPARNVRFFNAGQGGDTAAGGVARLERDVFSRQATVLTVAYGINDIGWGVHADGEHRQEYLDSIRTIINKCRKRDVRVFICSAAITAEEPETAQSSFLQKMCDEGLEIAHELDVGAIDVQRSMREVQKRVQKANKDSAPGQKTTTLHTPDGVHLNDLGQLAMAFAILKGLGAPSNVSSVTIDFNDVNSVIVRNCRVSDMQATADSLDFTRLDVGLPINLGLFGALQFRFVPMHNELNRYMLTVRNLPKGEYDLTVDERAVGTYRHDQLERGINISSSTANAWQPGGPWDVQSTALKALTEARSRLAISELTWTAYLKNSEQRPEIGSSVVEIDDKLHELQRSVARSQPYRFRLERSKGGGRIAPQSSAEPTRNRTISISRQDREKALADLPDIQTFSSSKSNRFLVDLDVVRTGHPYRGVNAERPHAGGHVYFSLPEMPIPSVDVDRFPAIYAVADGFVSRIDYSFRLREMFEPALNRRVANYRYGIGLSLATMNGQPVDFHYSIEPFVDPGDKRFYDRFILVKPGQRVKKGDIIARMYLPENLELTKKSHIHFNLNGGQDHRFMAPAIFSKEIEKRFYSTWRRLGRGNDSHIPPCLGFELAPHENPFGTGAKKTL